MGFIYRTIKIGNTEIETKGIFDILIVFLLVFLAYKVGQNDSLKFIQFYQHYCGENATFQSYAPTLKLY